MMKLVRAFEKLLGEKVEPEVKAILQQISKISFSRQQGKFAVTFYAKDKKNGINTLAVSFGEKNCKIIAYTAILISSILLTLSTHFKDYPLQNGIFEIQNAGIIF